MKKTKFIAVILILSIISFVGLNTAFSSTVNADTIKISKSVTGTDGSVEFNITNLNLDSSANYEWAIEKNKGVEIKNWYNVLAPDYENGKISITVSSSVKNQLEVLKSVDEAYLSLRKVGDSEKIIDEYKVNLSLPLSKAFKLTSVLVYSSGININTAVYGIANKNIQYLWEEITDPNIINNYIDNEHDISGLNLKGKEDFPSEDNTTWKSVSGDGTVVRHIGLPSKNGLYYLWIKGSQVDVKKVYGMTVVEIGDVKKISVDSNNSGKNDENNEETKNETTKTEEKKEETKTEEKLDPKNLISYPIFIYDGSRKNYYCRF